MARRAALLTAAKLMRRDRRPMVLYLRSFGDDDLRIRSHASRRHSLIERFVRRRREPFEEVVAWQLWGYGPVVAVSEPGTSSPPMGAAREELPGLTWQQRVEQWMGEARLIAVMVGRTQGLAWELEQLTQLRLWHKTVLVLPPVETAEARRRWASVRDLLGRAGLPAGLRSINPDRALALAVPPSGEAVVVAATKRNEWSYEVALEVVAGQFIHTATAGRGPIASRRDRARHPRPALTTRARSGTPTGWFADPYRRHELRYWDGWRWTEHVADRGIQAVDHS